MKTINTGEKNKITRCDLFFIFALLSGIIILIIRAPYGIGLTDESFYLTIPYRVLNGGALLSDEWHISQLSSVFLVLPVKIYLAIKGSTEGIILFMRYLYILVQSSCSTYIYVKLRKYGIPSLFGALIFFLYIPLSIMSLSYNTLNMIAVADIAVNIVDFENLKTGNKIVVGLLFVMAVLCNPVWLIPFLAYNIAVLVKNIGKNKEESNSPFSVKSWFILISVCLAMFIVFCITLLSNASLRDIMLNVKYIFNDPEYTFNLKSQNIIMPSSTIRDFVKTVGVPMLLLCVSIIISLLDRNRIKHRKIHLTVSSLLSVVMLIWSHIPVKDIVEMNTFTDFFCIYRRYLCIIPIALFGLSCYILSEKKDKKVFTRIWLLGVIMTFCIDISSDIAPITSVAGLTVSALASVIFIFNLMKEMKNETEIKLNRVISILMVAVISFQILSQIFFCASIYNSIDEKILVETNETLDVRIPKGPYKGVLTTKSFGHFYTDALNDLDIIKKECKNSVLVADNYSWMYLYLEKDIGTYSTWLISAKWFTYRYRSRLKDYYAMQENNFPDYAYVPYLGSEKLKYNRTSAIAIATDITNSFGGKITEGKEGYIIRIK